MKHFIFWTFLLMFLSSPSLFAQRQFQILRTLPAFTAVEASGGVDLYLTHGTGNSYLVEAEANQMEFVTVEVSNGRLLVSYSPKKMLRLKGSTVKVYVTFKQIEEIKASGASNIYSENVIEGKQLSVTTSGASDVKMEVVADILVLKSSGGSDIKLKGKVGTLNAISSGGSDIDARNLEVLRADLKASGGSDIIARVAEELSATASGGADITYYGNPTIINRKVTGGADIKRKN